jgi:hypothetical protein
MTLIRQVVPVQKASCSAALAMPLESAVTSRVALSDCLRTWYSGPV